MLFVVQGRQTQNITQLIVLGSIVVLFPILSISGVWKQEEINNRHFMNSFFICRETVSSWIFDSSFYVYIPANNRKNRGRMTKSMIHILGFCMVDKLLKAVHVLPICILISISVDEILLPKYINRSTNSIFLSFNKEIAQSWIKRMKFVLFEFMGKQISLAVCFRLCCRDSVWAVAFAITAKSSMQFASYSAEYRLILN